MYHFEFLQHVSLALVVVVGLAVVVVVKVKVEFARNVALAKLGLGHGSYGGDTDGYRRRNSRPVCRHNAIHNSRRESSRKILAMKLLHCLWVLAQGSP